MSDPAAPRRTVLIVEDDLDIQTLLAGFLSREGFEVEVAEDGASLDRALVRCRPDIIVLDLMLPGEDGLSICRRLRARSETPILMLTAKSDEIDRVVGLELGADDYLGKPFNPRELLARLRAILRRASRSPEMGSPRRRLAFAGLLADLDARSVVTEAGAPLPLTSAEFDLLACFLERPRRVLSRDQLLDWTRGRMADPFDRTIDVTVSRLRRKLDAVETGGEALITTVRNGGYLFAAEVREV
ncbi:response regulator [Bosea sp. 117]|uniref:response regulator n=1 Tax=Bosea sp. 117 TaxID=1125973 RepID=UPI0004945C6A|nr:response regulator [Bosea sp. 117]